jgi:hypothetical protein
MTSEQFLDKHFPNNYAVNFRFNSMHTEWRRLSIDKYVGKDRPLERRLILQNTVLFQINLF